MRPSCLTCEQRLEVIVERFDLRGDLLGLLLQDEDLLHTGLGAHVFVCGDLLQFAVGWGSPVLQLPRVVHGFVQSFVVFEELRQLIVALPDDVPLLLHFIHLNDKKKVI